MSARANRPLLTLVLFSIAYFLSLLDRQILTVLVEPVRADLGLSDKQFGLVQGFAFAIFYVAFGIPLAALADRSSRRNIIAGGLLLWSASTCVAGFTRTFGALFGARIGVGVGEACLAPAAYSTFTDLFGPQRIGRVIGAFHATGALGIAGSAAIGGVLLEHFTARGAVQVAGMHLPPWGQTLVAVGVPGILLSFVIALALREAPRRQAPEAAAARRLGTTARRLLAVLVADGGAFLRLIAGSCILAIAGNAQLTWTAAYLIRVFELRPSQVGGSILLSMGIGAIVGPLFGGALADQLFRRYGHRGPVIVLAACGLLLIPGFGGFAFVDTLVEALVVITYVSVLYSATLVVSASALQLRAPPDLRAQLAALLLCVNMLIGLGLGAWLVGKLNDDVFGSPLAVGRSIAVVATIASFVGFIVTASLLVNRGRSAAPA